MSAETAKRRRQGLLRRLTAPIRRRLKGRPDSEHEMTINRIVISTVVLAYLLIANARGHDTAQDIFHESLILFGIYYAASVLLFAHILREPGISHPRRILAIVLDIGMLSYGMHVGESAFAIGYPLYLWIIFGNGFRFGVRYLAGSAFAAILGFCFLIAMTPLWRNNLELSFGLLVGLVLLPAYVSALIRKLSEAKLQAEEAFKAKSLFLASVSHELRTPLNAIITLSDLLRGAPIPREQREMSETIGMSGRSLLKLINSILDISRMEAKAQEPEVAPFDLFAVMHDVRRMLAAPAEAKGLYLNVTIDGSVASAVVGHRHHLEEILTNLIGNATKFTTQGGVQVTVTRAGGEDERPMLLFSVRDTGIGISEAAQERIFEQFTQADHTIMDRFGGTGLGLAIVKQLVERQGGEIGVNSRAGEGSEFWLKLPFARQAEAPEREAARASLILLSHDFGLYTRIALECRTVLRVTDPARAFSEARTLLDAGERCIVMVDADTMPSGTMDALIQADAGLGILRSVILGVISQAEGAAPAGAPFLVRLQAPFSSAQFAQVAELAAGPRADKSAMAVPVSQLRVLVAEDNVTNQVVIRKLLERDRHDVVIVSNGEEAVETLMKREFDIVLMDINMPVMNGFEATKLYRFASLGSRRVPIYALTADVTEQTRLNCAAAGMDGCLHKPIEQAELLKAFAACVAGSEPVSQQASAARADEGLPQAGPLDLSKIAVLDHDALASLMDLGDIGFMQDLITQFLAGASETLDRIADAVAREDVTSFQDVLHALRSSAANLGARRVFALALEWRKTSRQELAEHGEERVAQLRAVFSEVDEALRQWLSVETARSRQAS